MLLFNTSLAMHPVNCECCARPSPYAQNLDEIDYQRSAAKAAEQGDIAQLKYLLNKGEILQWDSQGGSGYTPLHFAARNGHLECVELLLQKGANPNATTLGGATPLHRAAFTGHTIVCQTLLAAGADPLIRDSDGHSAVHKSVLRGHQACSQILLDAIQKQLADKDGDLRSWLAVEDRSGTSFIDMAKGQGIVGGLTQSQLG